MFTVSKRDQKFTLLLPKVKLEKSKQNFLFSTSRLWNKLINSILERCEPEKNGIVIPGSKLNSDLSAALSVIKSKVKSFLLKEQSSGDKINWD